uniref:hypothetical protein n=1 Tax=Pedobacter schmidteae TaxID=2201271 RepID=UPI000EB14F3A|nr:hypothetical protein [Pedobacter schmidteae]
MSDHIVFAFALISLFFLIRLIKNHQSWKRKNRKKIGGLMAKKDGNNSRRISVVDIKAAVTASAYKDFE